MWPSVTAAFRAFTARIEGVVPWMYLDVRCLVTVAIGNLVDPIEAAMALPFVSANGLMSSGEEIAAAWHAVKARTDLARMGGAAFANVTTIRLASEGIDALVGQRVAANEALLVKRFPEFELWPADAQLGLHSIAWAAGAGWRAPKFDAAARSLDFATCAGKPGDADADPACRGEAWLRDSVAEEHGHGEVVTNPGLRKRNLANKVLFANAAAVVAAGTDCSVLYWPGSPEPPDEVA